MSAYRSELLRQLVAELQPGELNAALPRRLPGNSAATGAMKSVPSAQADHSRGVGLSRELMPTIIRRFW